MFADTCYLNQEYHRAIHAIKKANLVQIDNVHAIRSSTLKAYLLLGQCMVRTVGGVYDVVLHVYSLFSSCS